MGSSETLCYLEDIRMILIPGVEIHEAEVCTPVSVGVDTHVTWRGAGKEMKYMGEIRHTRELAKGWGSVQLF